MSFELKRFVLHKILCNLSQALSHSHEDAARINSRYALSTKPASQPRTVSSIQSKLAVHRLQLGGLDEFGVRHRHREQRPLQLLAPEGKKIVQRREIRNRS